MKPNSFLQKIGLAIFMGCLFTIQAMAQPTFNKVFSPDNIGPGSSTTLTFIVDNTGGGTLTDLAFMDNLPTGTSFGGQLVVAAAPNATTSCTDGVITAVPGSSTISFANGRLAPGGTCTVSINVTVPTNAPDTYNNVSGDLTSSAGNSGTASDDLTVATNLPGFTKSFSADSIGIGEVANLTFNIDNTQGVDLFNLDFIDNLPAGLQIANPANLTTTCPTGAGDPLLTLILTAAPGSSQIVFNLTGNQFFPIGTGTPALTAGASCSISVDVESTGTTGLLENVTSNLSAGGGSGGLAMDAIKIGRGDPVHLQKSFVDDPAVPGGTVDLEFKITNFERTSGASNITFEDDLNAVLAGLAPQLPLPTDPCGAGSMLSWDGMKLTLSNGSLSDGQSPGKECVFTVTLNVPAGATPGTYINTTGALSSDLGPGNSATAPLSIAFAPLFTKEFTDDPVAPGDTVDLEFSITNTDPSNGLTDVAFTDNLTALLNGLNPVNVILPTNPVCGGTLSISSCGNECSQLELSGGAIAGGSNCTFTVRIAIPDGFPGGIYPNVTSELTATLNGSTVVSPPAADNMEVLFAPTVEKSFSADAVEPGEMVDVTFTLSYSEGASMDATNISFTDDLLQATFSGAMATISNPNNIVENCGGTVVATPGTTMISVSGVNLMPGESCSFTISLDIDAGATLGTYTNTTSEITATSGGKTVTGNPTSDLLLVNNFFFTKEFIGDPALPGETVTLRFTFDNTMGIADASITLVSDPINGFVPGLTVNLPPTMNTCGSSVSLLGSSIQISGGTVTAGNSCVIELDVPIPMTAQDGAYNNTTTSLFALIGGNVAVLPPASDNLVIDTEFLGISKEFTNDPVFPGDPVDLKFTIENLSAVHTVTDITFNDDLGTLLPGVTLNGLPMNVCGGTLDENPAGVLELTGATLNPGEMCMFTVNLTVPAAVNASNYTNTTGELTGKVGTVNISGGTATDVLRVRTLSLEKQFLGPGMANGTVTMRFTLTNLDAANNVTNINFFDELDNMLPGATVLTLPTPAELADCGESANVSASNGNARFNFMAGELVGGASCSFDVVVQLPCEGLTGKYANTTSDFTGSGFEGQIVAPPAEDSLDFTAAAVATFSAPADTTINCDQSTDPANTGDVIDEMHLCCTGLDATFSDVVVPGSCPREFIIQRTWSLVDCNGLMAADQVQQITVQDTVPPTLTCPMNTMIDCLDSTDPSNTGSATAVDNCDAMTTDISYSDSSTKTSNGSCTDSEYVITRTWNATDSCGNMATACMQTITVEDNTPPSIMCPANPMVIEWPVGFNLSHPMANQPQDPSIDPGTYGMPTGMDDCNTVISSFQDTLIGPTPANCPNLWIVERRWVNADPCGNESAPCVQTFTFSDTTPPGITCPPDPMPIEWPAGFNLGVAPPNTPQGPSIDPSVYGNPMVSDNCGTPTVTFQDSLRGPFTGNCTTGLWIVTRRWKATDACGLVDSCDQTFAFKDETGPLVNCPADTTVLCGEDTSPYATGMATGTDNCDPSPVYSETDVSTQTSDGSCTDHAYTITRTWQGIDVCGNLGATCDQIITVVDTVAPTVMCEPSDTVDCDDIVPALGTATAIDNCDPNPFLTFSDQSTATNDGSCNDFNYVITRSWFAFDVCNNVSTACVQSITVQDTVPPSIMCPANITVECDSIAPVFAGMATGVDNCDPNPIYSHADSTTATLSGGCSEYEYMIFRTWQGSDACSNQSASCVQTITVEDNTAPTLVCPANITVECDSIAPAFAGMPTVVDNCDSNPSVSFSDMDDATSNGTCSDHEYTIMRTWSAKDTCGNEAMDCVQTITVEDNTAPTITCPANTTVECNADNSSAATGMATAVDNCDMTGITFTEMDSTTQTSNGTCSDYSYSIFRTWRAQDVCGNKSATCVQTITVDDTTPPDVQCVNISVPLDSTGNLTLDPALVFDSFNSTDNCSATITPLSVLPNVFSCLDEGPNNVTLTAEDICGNQATCMGIVTIQPFLTIDSIVVVDESCAGSGNGSIQIFATSLGGQIGYSIDNGANYEFNNLFTNLTPGTYNIRVKVFGVAAICEKTAIETVGTSPNGALTWYKDADNDGYSDGVTQMSCTQPAGYKLLGDLTGTETDCDDNDPLEFPGQEWYPDADGDGYGTNPKVVQCERPAGHFAASELTESDTDCDDTDAAINPGATEVCNGIDDDCDGAIDEGLSGETFVGNIVFSTQAQLDDWPACYSKIDGSVTLLGSGITSLGPLGNITEITGNLLIQGTGLTNPTGLGALTTVGGSLTIYFNSSMTSLTGLGAVTSVGGNLSIYYNFLLTDCCPIKSLVSGTGVSGAILIFFNAVGCNSLAEILACPSPSEISNPDDNVIVTASSFESRTEVDGKVIAVFPNPTSTTLNILFGGLVDQGTIELADVIGRKVHQFKINTSDNVHQIDVSEFNHGVYLLTVKVEGQKPEVRRIVIE